MAATIMWLKMIESWKVATWKTAKNRKARVIHI